MSKIYYTVEWFVKVRTCRVHVDVNINMLLLCSQLQLLTVLYR